MESLELGGRQVAEGGVQAVVVEPGDVLDDRERGLGSGSPDAVADQFSLEAVDEALGERVVVGVAGAADGRLDVVVVEGLAVVDRPAAAALGSGIVVRHGLPRRFAPWIPLTRISRSTQPRPTCSPARSKRLPHPPRPVGEVVARVRLSDPFE